MGLVGGSNKIKIKKIINTEVSCLIKPRGEEEGGGFSLHQPLKPL